MLTADTIIKFGWTLEFKHHKRKQVKAIAYNKLYDITIEAIDDDFHGLFIKIRRKVSEADRKHRLSAFYDKDDVDIT